MRLLPLDDPRWSNYRGGYRTVFNPVVLIHGLLRDGATPAFWDEVWTELHHQGDVGEASYALVPYLVHWQSSQSKLSEQLFQYCVTVDLAQSEKGNPAIPPELEFSYALAIRELPALGYSLIRRGCPEEEVMGIAAATAIATGHRLLARAYLEFNKQGATTYLHGLYGYEPTQHDV
jgi:hypothetical protein